MKREKMDKDIKEQIEKEKKLIISKRLILRVFKHFDFSNNKEQSLTKTQWGQMQKKEIDKLNKELKDEKA
jgi:hypothetical protein